MKYKFENTKGVIRSRNSKNRRYNGHKIKNRRYNGHKIKDLQCTTWKTKHQTIQTSLKADGEIRCF